MMNGMYMNDMAWWFGQNLVRPTDKTRTTATGYLLSSKPWNKSAKIRKEKQMLKLIKRWANRHEIAELQLELKGLEARLPSMEDKVFRSRGTAEMWEEQVKSAFAPKSQKDASVAYYWNDFEKNETELTQMRKRVLEIKERLILLGL